MPGRVQRLHPQFRARLLEPRAAAVSICCQRQGPAAGPASAAGSREQEWTTGPAEIRASQGSALRSRGEGKDGPQGRSRRGLQEGRCPRVAWTGSQTGQGADTATHKPDPAAVGGGLGAGGAVLGSWGLTLGGCRLGNWGLGGWVLALQGSGDLGLLSPEQTDPHSDRWGVACLHQRDPPSTQPTGSQLLRTLPGAFTECPTPITAPQGRALGGPGGWLGAPHPPSQPPVIRSPSWAL